MKKKQAQVKFLERQWDDVARAAFLEEHKKKEESSTVSGLKLVVNAEMALLEMLHLSSHEPHLDGQPHVDVERVYKHGGSRGSERPPPAASSGAGLGMQAVMELEDEMQLPVPEDEPEMTIHNDDDEVTYVPEDDEMGEQDLSKQFIFMSCSNRKVDAETHVDLHSLQAKAMRPEFKKRCIVEDLNNRKKRFKKLKRVYMKKQEKFLKENTQGLDAARAMLMSDKDARALDLKKREAEVVRRYRVRYPEPMFGVLLPRLHMMAFINSTCNLFRKWEASERKQNRGKSEMERMSIFQSS